MDSQTKANISDRTIWVRILYTIFFAFVFNIAEFLVAVIVIFQTILVLITGRVNDGLHKFGRNLGVYITAIVDFVTFNSETVPFPFEDWPDADPIETKWSREAEEEPAPTPYNATPADNNPGVMGVESSAQDAAEDEGSSSSTGDTPKD